MNSFDTTHEVVLNALTHSVRLLSMEQIARLLAVPHDEGAFLVTELEELQLVSIEPRLVSVSETALQPLCAWAPGECVPDFRAVAYQLRRRWDAPQEMQLVFPEASACKQFGGTRVRPRSAGELDHDYWMAEVFLHYHSQLLNLGEQKWVSGDSLRSGETRADLLGHIPDACLVRSDETVERILESGGTGYAASKLMRLHNSYSQYSYEIW